MIRISRLFLPAAFAIAVGLLASVASAASPYGAADGSSAGYANPSGSQLTLVSANEEQPQPAQQDVRLADPRGTATNAASSQAATKSAPQRNSASKTKPNYKTQRPGQYAQQPPKRIPPQRPGDRYATRPAPQYYGQPRDYYQPRGSVQLTTHVVVDPSAPPEGVMRPGEHDPQYPSQYPPPTPEVDAGMGECPMCGNSCGFDSCCCQKCCGFCAGVDYLFLRPHFADDAAFEQSTATTTITTVTDVNRLVNFDEPYSSDYHFFLGYHNSCGNEFRFGFWHITDDGNRDGTVTGDFLAGAGVAYQVPGGTQLTSAGQTIDATAHMMLNMYDFEDFHRIDLPSFGCGCCPGWDLRWSFGLRVIDFKHTVDTFDPIETINNDAYFVGGGPKVGIEVRRQIGHSKFDIYVNTYAALLLGESRGRSTTTTPGVIQTAVDMNVADAEVKVPDFNITFGVEWRPCCNTSITAGWMLEDFGGLGTAGAPTCTTCSTTSGQIGGGDLSFDGLFVRAEHCF